MLSVDVNADLESKRACVVLKVANVYTRHALNLQRSRADLGIMQCAC